MMHNIDFEPSSNAACPWLDLVCQLLEIDNWHLIVTRPVLDWHLIHKIAAYFAFHFSVAYYFNYNYFLDDLHYLFYID